MSSTTHSAAVTAGVFAPESSTARVWRAWRALRWRHVAGAFAVGLALAVSNNIGLWGRVACTGEMGPIVDLYFSFILSMFLLLFAVVAADQFAVAPAWRAAPFALAVTAAIVASYFLCQLLEPVVGIRDFVLVATERGMPHADVIGPLYFLTNQGLQVAFVAFTYLHHRDTTRRTVALRAAQLERATLERQTIESRLQVMQAHVEPSFLFNTLAHVERLYDTDPVNADRMLDDLITYLRAALPHLRDTSSTVGNEVRLARSYLDILKLRLGGTLDYSMDVAHGAEACSLPPMLLLPLVDYVTAVNDEAAFRSLRISVGSEDDALCVTIASSSQRPHVVARSGAGGANAVHGLDPVRARLASLYGEGASLLSRRTTHGETAELVLTVTIRDNGSR